MRSLNIVCVLILVNFITLVDAANQWVEKADFAGHKRERAVGFAIGDRGYLCSGQDTADVLYNDLWEYSPASNSWSQKANLPGVPRRNSVAFVIGNRGYVGTGMDNSTASLGSTLSDFWAYNPATNSWTAKAAYPGAMGNGVYFAAAFSSDSAGYVCAGKVGPATYVFDLWAYDPILDTWQARALFPGGVRYKNTGFFVGGKGYVGLGINDDVYTSDFWAYDPATNQWTAVADFPGGPRGSVSNFVIGNRAFVCCGANGGLKKDVWEYDPIDDTWTVRDNLEGSARRYAISFSIQGRGYVGTGQGYPGLKRSFYEYQPVLLGVNHFENAGFTMWPNPADTRSELKFSVFGEYKIQVVDGFGRVLFSESASGLSHSLLTAQFSSGLYHVIVEDEQGRISSRKWVVK